MKLLRLLALPFAALVVLAMLKENGRTNAPMIPGMKTWLSAKVVA